MFIRFTLQSLSIITHHQQLSNCASNQKKQIWKSLCCNYYLYYSTDTGKGKQDRFFNNQRTAKEDKDDKPQPRKPRRYVANFIDSARIHVKGGAGGSGLPQRGGCGGKGGDIIVVGKKDVQLKDVLDLRPSKRFQGESGKEARFFCLIGEHGNPTTIEVPLGITVISEQGNKMGDINQVGDQVTVAKGGDGGSPNNSFCGMKGEAQSVTLDLKLIADIGFVGFPNAGKSTLLRALSRARPKVASYPFTTVRPNIGIMEFTDRRVISLADLPGLIEGAHLNTGMGHKFLKHVERTKLLLFIVDIHGFQLGPKYPRRTALETIILLNRELELYLSDLAEKPAMLVLNKFDLPDSYPIIQTVKETYKSKESLDKYIQTLPVEFQPQHPIQFQQILAISAAARDSESVKVLKDSLRTLIDVNDDLERAEIEQQMKQAM